jgi:hypothetical protein
MYPPESYAGDHKTWWRERIYRDPEFTNIVKGSCGMEKLTSCYAMIRCVRLLHCDAFRLASTVSFPVCSVPLAVLAEMYN